MAELPTLIEAHNVRVVGTGEEVVVLGHGFGTDQSVWQHIIPHLVDDYRVVLFDNMGAGTTDPEYFSFSRYSTLHGYADDLLAILDELDIESCTFVGHSVAGMVACLASLERPESFEKIITISASPRYVTRRSSKSGQGCRTLIFLLRVRGLRNPSLETSNAF